MGQRKIWVPDRNWPLWPSAYRLDALTTELRRKEKIGVFFFFVPSHALDMLITSFLFSSLSLKFTILLFFYHTHDNFDIADAAVRRTHVIHEPCIWPSPPRVLRTSVVRASNRCMEDHRFSSCWGLTFFLCPMLVTCWLHFSFLHRGLKLTIFLFICTNNV